jgi:hypothetical protein
MGRPTRDMATCRSHRRKGVILQRSSGYRWSISRGAPELAWFQADVCSSVLPLCSPFEAAGIPSIGWSSTNAPVTLSRAGFPVSLVKPTAVEPPVRASRRTPGDIPVPRVVGAIPFVGALWVRRPGRWTHAECLPCALDVVGGEAIWHPSLHGCYHLLGAELLRFGNDRWRVRLRTPAEGSSSAIVWDAAAPSRGP